MTDRKDVVNKILSDIRLTTTELRSLKDKEIDNLRHISPVPKYTLEMSHHETRLNHQLDELEKYLNK